MKHPNGRPATGPLRRRERGSAMLAALVVAALLAAVGAGILLMSNTERAIARNFLTAHVTRLAADAALERALVDLRRLDATDLLSDSARSAFRDASFQPVAPWGGSVDLTYLTAQLQRTSDGETPWSADAPIWQLLGSGPYARLVSTVGDVASQLYLVTWIGDDIADADGNPRVDSNDVVVIIAVALGPFGHRHTIRAAVAVAEEPRLLSWSVVD